MVTDVSGKRTSSASTVGGAPPIETEAEVGRPNLAVAVGASAGGLDSLRRFFAAIPRDIGAGFVVLYHADAAHPSVLRDLLAAATRLTVVTIEDGMPLLANRIHVMVPGTLPGLEQSVFRVAQHAKGDRHRPIDCFFTALARDAREQAVAVVLSGTGDDGSAGVTAVHRAGGWTLAEAASTARFPGMPASAMATGCVDVEAAVDDLAKLVATGTPNTIEDSDVPATARHEDVVRYLPDLCQALERGTGHDFRDYKPTTLVRRVLHRMHALHLSSTRAYVRRLQQDAAEPELLLQDVLIGVTRFFRDPEAFAALEQLVIGPLLDRAQPDGEIRVWVAGCATGEEAYSIAMLIIEGCETRNIPVRARVFATDIDGESLELARWGRYPLASVEQIQPARVARFFVKVDGQWEVARIVRDLCVFSHHNVLHHPPFVRIDLLSCRNLLIYFDIKLQRRLQPLFHFALAPGGHLFLGPSEQADDDQFQLVDRRARLFQRRDLGPQRPLPDFPMRLDALPGADTSDAAVAKLPDAAFVRRLELLLLTQYGPASVVVTERGLIAYSSGPVARYFAWAPGLPTLDAYQLVRADLRPELRSVVRQCVDTGSLAQSPDVFLDRELEPACVRLEARPLQELSGSPLTLVLFHERPIPVDLQMSVGGDASGAPAVSPTVARLRLELESAQAHARAVAHDADQASYDQRRVNEELLAINEEAQSTNEEMQATKEEVQAVNEELEAVNANLKAKIDELTQVNADLQNLLRATEIATIFLGADLCIRRFTPASRALFRLINSDIGRPIVDITNRFGVVDLLPAIEEVLEVARPVEREVTVSDGDLEFYMRILPYHTAAGVADGVVLTFSDITQLKRTQRLAERLAAEKSAAEAMTVARLEAVMATRAGVDVASDPEPSRGSAQGQE